MADAALIVFAFAMSYLGFALLALSQRPHHAAVAAAAQRADVKRAAAGRSGLDRSRVNRSGVPRATRMRCVGGGALLLAGSFAASLEAEGPSFGSVLWLLGLAGTSVGVMFTLTYRPRWLLGLQRAVARG